ncbi:phytoene/squalene synthase family protein [Jiulongibacter sediminis]|uniref:Phytoene synthase n=1 Tax=Jiulongibacter sediminis TaxID=1605367 RepID=A0A0P7BEU6_9BACT|nr:phytoene/squalene synthase family protein [Jiulongibacter sediminis]KPM49326.1 phytoene synthase [Jiulongibacter sediminis]TBX26377.1 phytoene synthase [Jiulongibacter sediminis]
MKKLFDSSSYDCSKLITNTYSTSFSLGIKLFGRSIRPAIYAIYGFVRYADEIVDTFHDYDQEKLLDEFEEEYQKAIDRKISLNPILNSFQEVVHNYELYEYVEDFMRSMRYDLSVDDYTSEEAYKDYIYGSADVVGLMCLRVFVNNDNQRFEELKGFAKHLGSAFQKVNFLRDLNADLEGLGRSYFPNLTGRDLNDITKQEIIADIEADFAEAYKGVVKLPLESRLGVYLAYRYYQGLLRKLKRLDCTRIMTQRTRISDPIKLYIMFKAIARYKLNLI